MMVNFSFFFFFKLNAVRLLIVFLVGGEGWGSFTDFIRYKVITA